MHGWGVAFIWLWFSQIFSGQRERKVWDGELEHLEQSRAIMQCQGEVLKKVSQVDGGEKAEFKGLPAASEEGGRLPSILLS